MEPKDFLTPANPLGPFRQEAIIKRTEGATPNLLLYQNAVFDQIIERQRPIIIGRRGSGKTSIVASLSAKSGQEEYYYTRRGAPNTGHDLYVFINSWDHLDQLVDKVGLDSRYSIGTEGDWSSLLPETAARHWTRRIWMVIFEQIYKDSLYDTELRERLPEVIKYVEARDIIPLDKELTDSYLTRLFTDVRGSVCKYLRESGRTCVVIIDSFEEYPVLAPRFQKLIAGLLKSVNDFHLDFSEARIICCIPEEIAPYFELQSSNHLKDLSVTASVSRLRWRPIDLLKIVAERYREFLQLYCQDDKPFLTFIMDLDLSDRSELSSFYAKVMPNEIVNLLGRTEPTLGYIVRHTQLLPREFLMIFDAAVRRSHEKTGSWRQLDPAEIVRAVEEQEPELAKQILTPYRTLFPELLGALRRVLPELSPICTLRDLDKLRPRFGRRVHDETADPWEALFQIGVIGYIEERQNCTDGKYDYGRFHFNSVRPITFANGRRYCVHPIFSGSYSLIRKEPNMKCVYPADVTEELP
jgi:hypothetical protein